MVPHTIEGGGYMKKIEAIIRPAKVGDVCDALDKVGHPGVMITEEIGRAHV